MECPICYESLDSGAYSTICGHVFGECILKAIERFELELVKSLTQNIEFYFVLHI